MVQQRSFTRIISGLGAVVLLAGIASQILLPGKAFAAAQPIITPRSLTLEAGATCGGSSPSGIAGCTGTVKHLFDFKVDGNNTNPYTVGSISLQYCTTADAVASPGIGCIVPAGLDLTAAAISSEVGSGITGWTAPVLSANEDAGAVNNTITISQASAVTVTAATVIKEEFSGIVNPDNTHCYGGTAPASNNCTFYVRIYVFAGTGGGTLNTNTAPNGTTAEDYGVVAASTATPITLTGNMPESLTFCTGATIGVNAGNVPDCSTATSGDIGFDRLFSPTDTAQATSQMAASTNATDGYAITVNGPTLTNGSYSIAGMGTTAFSVQGTPQFGMNLVKNTTFCGATCDLGADVTAAGGSLYNGEALAGYNTGGANCATAGCAQFKFTTGDTVADSLLGNSSTGASDGQIYTVSYIANVPGSQAAGTYTTTLTYICTPTF